MFSTNMTAEQLIAAWESQRRQDLHMAKQMRDQWQREVDRLEAMVKVQMPATPEPKP